MPKRRDEIHDKAVEILKSQPHGMRYAELGRKLQQVLPHIPKNAIWPVLDKLHAQLPQQVCKPQRGLFLHASFREAPAVLGKAKEEDFYGPFATWLIKELEECTTAIAVGRNLFKEKCGTPDVIGVREPKKGDIIKFPTEIISAEIKLDPSELITAFGQACAYRLFSHKSYLVVPIDSPPDDVGRLDTLSRIFGIGLILFNPKDPADPQFQIRARALKYEPDMFYVNRYLRLIEGELFR